MTRKFATFVRAFSVCSALLIVFLSIKVCADGDAPSGFGWVIAAAFLSAGLTVFFAFRYASHIEMTLDHDEQLEEFVARISRLESLLGKQAKGAATEAAALDAAQQEEAHVAPASRLSPVKPIPLAGDPERIMCPHCGEIQKSSRGQCWDCGIPFVTE